MSAAMMTAPEIANEPVSDVSTVHEESIAKLAYALWEARGCPDGSPEEDWFQAEAELNAKS